LRGITPGFHRRVYLVAGAIEKAGVDEHDAVPGRMDAGGQIHGRAPLLVHDAHFQGVAGEAQQILDFAEQAIRQGHFLGAVHLRLDDVDRAAARVAQLPGRGADHAARSAP
jgi:hypothetical protein